MSQNDLLLGAALVACVGGVSDLRSARIPNWLTYCGLIAALLARLILFGWSGFMSGVIGFLAAGVFFFFLFMVGAMGGGDVKLMSCVGAWAGSSDVLSVLIAAALAGGVLALIYVFFRQGIRQTFWNVVEVTRFRLTSGFAPHPVLNVANGTRLRVPFGVAIAMGTLFCAANAIWWR